MKRILDRSTLARRYLRPMGIESWVHRAAPVAPGPSQPKAVVDVPAQRAEPLYQLDAAAVDRWLTENRFQTLAAGDGGNLLLVMERRAINDAADQLLASMLKAISLEMSLQRCICQHDGGEPLQYNDTQTRAILLMASLAQATDVSSLAHLRESLLHHTNSGLALAVTIHPNDLLENNAAKRPAWEDLKRLKSYLDEQQR